MYNVNIQRKQHNLIQNWVTPISLNQIVYLTLSYFKIRSSGCCQCPHLHPLDTTISRRSRWFLIPSIYIWSHAGFVHGKSQILGKNIPEKASHQWLLESGIQMSRFPCCSCGIILRCVLDFFSEFSHRIKSLMPISGGGLIVHPFSCLPFPVSRSHFLEVFPALPLALRSFGDHWNWKKFCQKSFYWFS